MKTWTIYKLTNTVNGKAYIGQTKNLSDRITSHKSHKKLVISRAIQKYGWDNFRVEVLCQGLSEDAVDLWEQLCILKHKTLAPNGYNVELGGHGQKSLSEHTRNKLSILNKKRFESLFERKRTSEGLKRYYRENPGSHRKNSEAIKKASAEQFESKYGMTRLELHIFIKLCDRIGWSDRKIAKVAGFTHPSIRKYRAVRSL